MNAHRESSARDHVDGERGDVERKVTPDDPLCDPADRVGHTGLMKNHDVGFGI